LDAQERSVEGQAPWGWPLPDAHQRVVVPLHEARERCAELEARFRKEQVRKARASPPPANVRRQEVVEVLERPPG